jgi:sugar lactone lactonase YvrE
MILLRILCGFAFALAAHSVAAQPVAQGGGRPALDPATLTQQQISGVTVPEVLYQLAATYKAAGDHERLVWSLQRLIVLQPNVGDIKLALATAYAVQGDKSRTYDTLLRMQQQGYGYDLGDNPNFKKVHGTEAWDFIVDSLRKSLAPFGEGKVAFTLPRGDHLYESLAWDPKRERLLVGSVRDGTIQIADAQGRLKPFIAPDARNGLWSVYAMAAVPEDDALYVASTSSVYFKGFSQQDFGKAGVFRFRLSDGQLVEKFLLESGNQPNTLSSIAAGPGGRVFAADGLRNIIYKLDGGALKPMVANPRLTSVRGLALSGDRSRLYFADHTLGVFGVDLAAGKAFDLGYDVARLVLGGVDGLYWYDGTLVAIENRMSPRRVMRLHLSDDGRAVVRAMPLDAGKPEFELPTYGAVAGDQFYFIANSQKNAYDAYGSPKDASKLEPVKVYRSNLRFAWAEGGVEMAAPARRPLSTSKPGNGRFSNVEGGSNSVTGD